MLDSIRLRCPECDRVFHQSVAYVTGQIKAMKIGKVGEVAQQLKEKRGPYYDKWLKAMKARGEQKRCKSCRWFKKIDAIDIMGHCGNLWKEVNPGQYACRRFYQESGD